MGDFTLLGYTFSFIWAVIVVMIWIALAFWPARVAGRKGYSFLLYFIISLFFWWITLFVVYMMPDRTRRSSATESAPPPAVPEA